MQEVCKMLFFFFKLSLDSTFFGFGCFYSIFPVLFGINRNIWAVLLFNWTKWGRCKSSQPAFRSICCPLQHISEDHRVTQSPQLHLSADLSCSSLLWKVLLLCTYLLWKCSLCRRCHSHVDERAMYLSDHGWRGQTDHLLEGPELNGCSCFTVFS